VSPTTAGEDPALWLVIPTYNEASNLEGIVAAARRELEPEAQVLIVDDSSPDGTGRIADRLAEQPGVSVLHRPRKEGLGSAYVAGFREALAGGAQLIAQMDADFSHDPADLPRLIAATGDADLVLGSRYVHGGGVEDWGPLRRLVSRSGCAYARAILGVGVRDLTGGFKVFRRQVLERIDLESITAFGYAFQVETTYRAICAGFRVVELPIVFRDRHVGESKMTNRIVFEAAWRVPAMRVAGGPHRALVDGEP
jgi:dolichol-phosphate mannosyltransferase